MATTFDASGSISVGGTAQNVFTSQPSNGYSISNPDAANDLWIRDDGSAAVANGQGSHRVAANGGYYETPPGQKPMGNVSIVGANGGQVYTAKCW